MFKWLAILVCLVLITLSFGAMGIGSVAMLKFVLAFCGMSFAVVLLVWFFLKPVFADEKASGKIVRRSFRKPDRGPG